MTKIQEALGLGHEIWLDNLSRELLKTDGLKPWLEKGVTGITSNPSIFLKSITNKELYPELADGAKEEFAGPKIVEAIYSDIALAADKLKGLYDSSNGKQGFVSVELNPHFAADKESSLLEAKRIMKVMGDRPNYMIKIASNGHGVGIMEELLQMGVNVNMTLIFDLQQIEEIMAGCQRAFERRKAEGGDLSKLNVVMSFFLSRLDVAIDPRLKEKNLTDMEGKSALAIAHSSIALRERILQSQKWQDLIKAGANAPRLLWASTGTKNPEYPDTYYVDNLVVKDTVDTIPEKTLLAYLDHGKAAEQSSKERCDESEKLVRRLKEEGIDPHEVAQKLFVDGLKQFMDAYDAFFATIKGESANPGAEYENLKKYYKS